MLTSVDDGLKLSLTENRVVEQDPVDDIEFRWNFSDPELTNPREHVEERFRCVYEVKAAVSRRSRRDSREINVPG